ncbi:ABC-2 type transport system permease protein [Alkalibacillus flavidus]|uniref:ABC-2 type transport system permease protein n=1 Tax=Alkalibacillus flavidus TaxID=546021 RepID=A0ABV2KWT1_9BACI
MFPKALWMKEWKHNALISVSVFIAFLLAYFLNAILSLDTWRTMAEKSPQYWEQNKTWQINSLFSPEIFGIIAIGLVILLAGFLIGLEKSAKRHDFSMALPFSRRQMFLTKYLYGMLTIVLGYSLSYWLAILIINQSEFSDLMSSVEVFEVFITPLVTYLFIFAFSLMIGSITGEIKSQIALTFIFMFLPQGLLMLTAQLIEVHGGNFNPGQIDWVVTDLFWVMYFTPGMYDQLSVWTPAVALVIVSIAGLWLFEKAPSEYTGDFITYRTLHPVFLVGIPVCSVLLGGLLVSSVAPYNSAMMVSVILYWIGALIFLFFSWKITKRLLNRA